MKLLFEKMLYGKQIGNEILNREIYTR